MRSEEKIRLVVSIPRLPVIPTQAAVRVGLRCATPTYLGSPHSSLLTPHSTRGFTLLEMLVAVAIFAILAVVAHSGLNSVLLTQARVEESARALTELQQAYRWLQRDLEQVVARPVRDELGGEQLALQAGSRYGVMLALTRGGWRNPAGQDRSTLMRVAYRLDDETLVRHQWLVLDRAQDSEPLDRELLEGVESLELRWLDSDGDWQPQWPPPNVPEDAGLPRAAEVILRLADRGELRWLFRLPE